MYRPKMNQRDGKGNKDGSGETRVQKQELTESTGVKNEKMDITSHTKCRMVLENSLGKGVRTQPVLSLILVVIRSQKSSPLPLP